MAGSIVHFELPAADTNRAAGFWSGVFGWNLADTGTPGMDYRMAEVAPGQAVAVFESEQPGTGPVVYLGTEDIERSIDQVRSLGGEAESKAPVPGHGWFAPCRDTEGNRFRLWQADESATMPA